MAEPSWRVVILTAIPEAADMLANTMRRMGHDPVAAVGALRRRPTPGLTALSESSPVSGTRVVMAPDRDAVEPILRSLEPDVVLSWAFPWRVPDGALEVPALGAVNYHPSLLPRHRGPNPVAWTIRSGDSHFGVTWHRMASTYDTGPILAQRSTPVVETDTVFDVVPRLNVLAIRMLRQVLERVAQGDPGDPQPTEGATEAAPFGEDYARIDWSMPARSVHTQVRAWAFTPGTHSVVGPVAELDGHPVLVKRTSLQPPGGDGDGSDREFRRVECGDGPIWVLESELLP
jgi:methionyl-tRNA formyltransferase